MKYLWTTICVKNLDESLVFYEKIIGLPLNCRFTVGLSSEIAFMGEGETKIELIYDEKTKVENNQQGISLGFKVNSLQDTMDLMKKNNVITTDIYSPNPKMQYFFIDDPNGIRIQLVEEK